MADNIKRKSLSRRKDAPTKDAFDEYRKMYDEIAHKMEKGEKVYVEFKEGERKGSIAYIAQMDMSFTETYRELPFWNKTEPRWQPNSWSSHTKDDGYYDCDISMYVILRWEGRQNKVKCSLHSDGMNYLPDYEGPTKWEKWDKKAAELKALENLIIKDREGNELELDDKVLYINARYGGAASLDRGTIKDIRIKVQMYNNKLNNYLEVTILNENGQTSKISSPEDTVLLLKSLQSENFDYED